ncbi:DUF423 domain-containing protein [Cellulophaga tyrosinoxydans]|uniref:Uncharacterized membrane protein YgdD, TMEM256/DUF423 family n=1 Tax=Cellulophaga tyrosinoxydans TaxID=504486 RepID=A0A1W1Z6H3_9FLAO|nr:DUF423 domain-containing protein [Cellulophaga tyrosinoxydans]SMC44087.1 Uncharacterized membrane protein YgdD, TMEM256/DUF423 family [Cellulophaga tyrosinoxydans]
MNKTIFATGIVFGTAAVLLGAFAAHGLKTVLATDALESFKTGATYQMYHAIILLVLANTAISDQRKKVIYWVYTLGIIFFSFSIYLLATSAVSGLNFKSIAFVTPIGGLLLIIGWVLFGFYYLKENK